jgi:hypothetical protein
MNYKKIIRTLAFLTLSIAAMVVSPVTKAEDGRLFLCASLALPRA